MIGFLAALVISQAAIPTISVPPQTEPTLIFMDNGSTYLVGLKTETVTKLAGGITPTPGPTPGPVPPPVPVPNPTNEKPAWFSIVVEPTDPAGLQLRADKSVRDALGSAGVQFRAYASNQAEVQEFGLAALVKDLKLPALVTQRADGTVLEVRPIAGPNDILEVVKSWKK